MADESAGIRFCGSAYCLIVQVQFTRASGFGDDQVRQSALADLPGAVDHHDPGIRQRVSDHPLGMPRKQARLTNHGARLQQMVLIPWPTCR